MLMTMPIPRSPLEARRVAPRRAAPRGDATREARSRRRTARPPGASAPAPLLFRAHTRSRARKRRRKRARARAQVRANSRLKYLLHTIGVDNFRTLVEAYSGKAVQPWVPLPAWRWEDWLGWHEQVGRARGGGVSLRNVAARACARVLCFGVLPVGCRAEGAPRGTVKRHGREKRLKA